MKLHIRPDTASLSSELAAFIRQHILDTLKQKDRYTLVLSGGSTPKQLYRLLASAPYQTEIPWEKVHIFWGDERFVPFEDDRNNARMAYEVLLNHVAVKPGHVHVMRTDLTPEASVAAYTEVLEHYFPQEDLTFDLVLLGMGDDGHTLSLFPGTAVVHETEKWVDAFFLEAQQMYRITLTAPVVNKAAAVAFLAVGQGKAEVLKEVLEGVPNPDRFPSRIIQPSKGELHWFVDEAAAALLTGSYA